MTEFPVYQSTTPLSPGLMWLLLTQELLRTLAFAPNFRADAVSRTRLGLKKYSPI